MVLWLTHGQRGPGTAEQGETQEGLAQVEVAPPSLLDIRRARAGGTHNPCGHRHASPQAIGHDQGDNARRGTRYTYDAAGQLLTATKTDARSATDAGEGEVDGGSSTRYGYDSAGRRTSSTRGKTTTTTAYDAIGQPASRITSRDGVRQCTTALRHDTDGTLDSITSTNHSTMKSRQANGNGNGPGNGYGKGGRCDKDNNGKGNNKLGRRHRCGPPYINVSTTTTLDWDSERNVPQPMQLSNQDDGDSRYEARINLIHGSSRAFVVSNDYATVYYTDSSGSTLHSDDEADLTSAKTTILSADPHTRHMTEGYGSATEEKLQPTRSLICGTVNTTPESGCSPPRNRFNPYPVRW